MNKLENILDNSTRSLWKIWGIAFLYTCIISVFVQFILLPFLLPRLHAGGGLFIGSPDSLGFNQMAIDMVKKIKTSGWGAWELRPQGQAPAGIAAFIYTLTWSKFWVLIPLNAALHAGAFLILIKLINLFLKNIGKSFLCALPFLIFPSNLQWTAQLHKDGFSILGVVLILQWLVSLSRLENYKARNWFFINFRSIVFCVCGFILIWLVRPYILTIMKPFVEVFFFLLFLILLIRTLKKRISWKKTLFVSLSMLLVFFLLSQKSNLSSADFRESTSLLDSEEKSVEYEIEEPSQPAATVLPIAKEEPSQPAAAVLPIAKEEPSQPAAAVLPIAKEEPSQPAAAVLPIAKEEPSQPAAAVLPIAKEGIRATSPGSESVITAQPTTVKLLSKEGAAPISLSSEQKINKPETRKVKVKVKKLIKNDSIENHWKRSFWLPLFIENKARFLAQIRKGYRLGAPRAKSNIDTDIGFSSIKDMLIYLPRAAQIVLLAPFPGQWFSEGSSPGSYFMHKIPIFEMPVVYFFLLFLPYAIWYWRKRIEIWIIFLFCIYMMLIYGLVICNVGTLYRMRYGYITILVALGIAGFIVFLEKFKSKNGDSV